jgi:hypothetical protein
VYNGVLTNSDSPYHCTAKTLMTLRICISIGNPHVVSHLRVGYDYNRDNSTSGDSFAPVMDDHIACDNFEWYKGSFENEEIISSSNTEGFVNISTSESNKWRGDGQIRNHFVHALYGMKLVFYQVKRTLLDFGAYGKLLTFVTARMKVHLNW